MVYLYFTIFFVCVASLQACPEPVTVHIQQYEGPVILHTANCDNQQQRNHGNHYKQPSQCELDCSCVSKQSYAPCVCSKPLPTSSGTGCCSVVDEGNPLVFVLSGYDGTASPLKCVNGGYNNYPFKYPGYY